MRQLKWIDSSGALFITYKNELRGVKTRRFAFLSSAVANFPPCLLSFHSRAHSHTKCDTLGWWTGSLFLRIIESDISVYFSWACISVAEILKSLKHSYLRLCVRPALHVCVQCVLPTICVLELVNQPVVFQWRTSTQSLSVRRFPRDAPSLSLLPWILILIKSAEWQSRLYKWKRKKKIKLSAKVWKGNGRMTSYFIQSKF